jgi:DNA polymerase elongation subunit (family B)
MKTLLIDIETAPNRVYTWGLFNQNVAINQIDEPGYTLCWAAKWVGNRNTMFSSIQRDGKRSMVTQAYELLNEADAVVHYNGTRFDIPTLNQEFLSQGFGPPSPVVEIDLLRTARRRFRLPSNKLSYVAAYLNVGEKISHKGMELWRECMQGDAEAWRTMEQYNKQDVVLLERVYERLLPWIPNHPNHALFVTADAPVCPNCGSTHVQKRGTYYTKTMQYQRYHCQECGTWSRGRTSVGDKETRQNTLVGVV